MKKFLSIIFIIVIPLILTCSNKSTNPNEGQCEISVISPFSYSNWINGEQREIIWERDGFCEQYVSIELYKGQRKICVIEDSTWNDRSHLWTVDNCDSGNSDDYRIKITDLYSGESDYSNNFSINDFGLCQMTITRPGGIMQAGNPIAIRWNYSVNCGQFIKIELYDGESNLCEIIDVTENDGEHDWIISDCGNGTDSNYVIKITDLNTELTTYSNPFTILEAGYCLLQFEWPTLGYRWIFGRLESMGWFEIGQCDTTVKLELYKNSIYQCDIGTTMFPNSGHGTFDWEVIDCGGGSGSDYQIKIINQGNGEYAFSDQFTINYCKINVLIPHEFTPINMGDSAEIIWTSEGSCGSGYRVELYKGINYICQIADSVITPWPHTIIGDFSCATESGSDYRLKVTNIKTGDYNFGGNFSIQ
jgi:hypothetical protein